MDEHPKPGSKSTWINGAPKFWSWDIGTPWLHMGNDSESKRVNIFACYIDFKNWINHLKTTNYRGIYSSKIAFLPYWIQTKNPRQSVFTLKFGQTKRWQLRRLLLFNDEKYYHSNIFPHRVFFSEARWWTMRACSIWFHAETQHSIPHGMCENELFQIQ